MLQVCFSVISGTINPGNGLTYIHVSLSGHRIIQSHFSVDSYHEEEVCFGRIRMRGLLGTEDFPCIPVSTGILSNTGPGTCQTPKRPSDWNWHCQETVWHTAWRSTTRNSHPKKIRDRFRLYIQNIFSVFQLLICTGIHFLKWIAGEEILELKIGHNNSMN